MIILVKMKYKGWWILSSSTIGLSENDNLDISVHFYEDKFKGSEYLYFFKKIAMEAASKLRSRT